MTSLYGAIEKSDFFIMREKAGEVIEFGPLWAGTNVHSLRRTVEVLKFWLGYVRESARSWWDSGAGEGGGLAMNDGIAACVRVLRTVMSQLEESGSKIANLPTEDLCHVLAPYGEVLGKYFAGMSSQERKMFRDLRGNQGLTKRIRQCQLAIREHFTSFNPPGLEQFIEEEKLQTNTKAKQLIDRMELILQKTIVEELKQECGDQEWWVVGVPKAVRVKATQRREEDDDKRGGQEYYLDLIDYRATLLHNWQLFESLLAYGTGNKEKRTSWLVFLNDKRRTVAHASSAASISLADLGRLEEYDAWLARQVLGRDTDEARAASELDDG